MIHELYSITFMERKDVGQQTKDFYKHLTFPENADRIISEIRHALETRLKDNVDEGKHIYEVAEIIRINYLGYTFDELPAEIFKQFLLEVIWGLDLYEIAKEIYSGYKRIKQKVVV